MAIEPNTASTIPKPNNKLAIKHPMLLATMAKGNSIANKHSNSLNLNCTGPKLIGCKTKHKTTYMAIKIEVINSLFLLSTIRLYYLLVI